MRDGFKIFDSDTHLNPMAETLEPYFDAAMRKRLPEWESCKVPFRVGWAGEILQPPYRHRYQFKKRAGWRERLRILGEAGPREHIEPHFPKFMGSRFPTPGGLMTTSTRAFGIWTRREWTSSLCFPDYRRPRTTSRLRSGLSGPTTASPMTSA